MHPSSHRWQIPASSFRFSSLGQCSCWGVTHPIVHSGRACPARPVQSSVARSGAQLAAALWGNSSPQRSNRLGVNMISVPCAPPLSQAPPRMRRDLEGMGTVHRSSCFQYLYGTISPCLAPAPTGKGTCLAFARALPWRTCARRTDPPRAGNAGRLCLHPGPGARRAPPVMLALAGGAAIVAGSVGQR
jgi:hypothetical protein